MSEFYPIETPPSSSSAAATSKDDESIGFFQTKKRMKLLGQISNCKTDQVRMILFIQISRQSNDQIMSQILF